MPVAVIPNREGFGFLSAVGGLFQGGGECIHLDLHRDHQWYLQGNNVQGIGARALGVKTARQSWYKIEVKEYQRSSATKKRVRLLPANGGFCVLSQIGGQFLGGAEHVGVSLDKDGYWYLDGSANTVLSGRALVYEAVDPAAAKAQIQEYSWRAGQPPVKMIHQGDGLCFLSLLGGGLRGGGEEIKIYIDKDDYWYLGGHPGQASLHARAMSVVFPEVEEETKEQ